MDEKEFYTKLGAKCKELREELNVSFSDMLSKTGLSRGLLYDFENKGKRISAYRLNKVMQVLGLDPIEEIFQKKNTEIGMRLNFACSRL